MIYSPGCGESDGSLSRQGGECMDQLNGDGVKT